MTIMIDPEFRDLIQPLTDEERTELESSLKSGGCRDALICWNQTLLDGHNRFEICERLNIPYTTKEINLSDRDAAKEWIITNQLARRNLNLYQRTSLVLLRDEIVKARAKERQQLGGKEKGKLHLPEDEAKTTNETLAKMAGTGHDTVHRVRVINAEAGPEVKEKLRKGQASIKGEFTKLRANKSSAGKSDRIAKIKEMALNGYKSDQIAPIVGISATRIRLLARESSITLPDALTAKTRKLDVNRIISETVMAAQGLSSGLELIDSRIEEIDTSKVDEWIKSLIQSVAALNHLIRKLKGINK